MASTPFPRQLALAQDRLATRELPTQRPQERRVLQRLRRATEAQPEQFLADLPDAILDLALRQLANLGCLHFAPPAAAPSRTTNRHRTGSFAAASSSARLVSPPVQHASTPPLQRRRPPRRPPGTGPAASPQPARAHAGRAPRIRPRART